MKDYIQDCRRRDKRSINVEKALFCLAALLSAIGFIVLLGINWG